MQTSPAREHDVINRVLSAWTALEVLSPQAFQRGEKDIVLPLHGLRDDALPWLANDSTTTSLPACYQLLLGTLDLAESLVRLIAIYGDSRPERPPMRGSAILAVATADASGKATPVGGITVSSFAWGLPRALQKDLRTLDQWPDVSTRLTCHLQERLSQPDTEPTTLDADQLKTIFLELLEHLGLDEDLVPKPTLCIRAIPPPRGNPPQPPNLPLLNSFVLDDIIKARRLFNGKSTEANLTALAQYMNPTLAETRIPLSGQSEERFRATKCFTQPRLFPPGRWPGRGRYPLVLNQQLAVNAAMQPPDDSRILSVNGPPGTGKTTLLRDIVAANIVKRAEAMAAFPDPSKTFAKARKGAHLDGKQVPWHSVDNTLAGYEMLVVSSNNNAVENVTRELPGAEAIAEDASDLRYFTTISDAVTESATWGLVAAVLGRSKNRRAFADTFWWDRNTGMRQYLAAARGKPPRARKPAVTAQEDPPVNHHDALQRWKTARKNFQAALAASQERAEVLQSVYAYTRRDEVRTREMEAEQQRQREQATQLSHDETQHRRRQAAHRAARPGLLCRLLGTHAYRRWREDDGRLDDAAQTLEADRRRAEHDGQDTIATIDRTHRKIGERFMRAAPALLRHDIGPSDHPGIRAETPAALFEQIKSTLGDQLLDESFDTAGHEDQQIRTPWYDPEAHRTRDDVFVAAMKLHKAFVDAAATPLSANLGLLIDLFRGKKLDPPSLACLPHIWRSLFLVIPVASSTFASIGRMLGDLPSESLGWLLVDEAGQAVPQSAVGALMRTKRAVIVGDPLQVEPVVTMPDEFTTKVFEHFGADPDRFNAPSASVQTLADAAGAFRGVLGERTVGVPLLVHRRCEDPMFSISNDVAYDNQMVSSVRPGESAIRNLLGDSQWFDVKGQTSGQSSKWCRAEGDFVLNLLRRLATLDNQPDIYLISPFREVAERLRDQVLKAEWKPQGRDPILTGLKVPPAKQSTWVTESIGTVHTFQGKEAECVIFVLGAPDAKQRRSRDWAGGSPNLVNVAVSRAKKVLYVVGNREQWRTAGCFLDLDRSLPSQH